MGVEKKLGVKKIRSKEISLNFTKEIPIIFYKEFPCKLKIDEKFPKNWIARNFLKNLKIVIFFLFFFLKRKTFPKYFLYFFFKGKKLTKNRQKLTCSQVFEKFENCFFTWFFRRRCLIISSEGTKNNQKKISSCLREICKFRKIGKKPTPVFCEIFWNIFFLSFLQKIF